MQKRQGGLWRKLLGIGRKPGEKTVDAVSRSTSFLSAEELSFLGMLHAATGDSAVICPKVCLSDVFSAGEGALADRIAGERIDFLLCDPGTMEPLLGVTLAHGQSPAAERAEAQAFMDRIFGAASLPLVRFSSARTYRLQDVADAIGRALDSECVVDACDPPRRPDDEPPNCPVCGSQMKLRRCTEGPHQGDPFYGCSRYPECTTTVEVSQA